MLRSKSALGKAISDYHRQLSRKDHISGFDFILDSEDDPYTVEAATAAGFPPQPGEPAIEGFFYLTDEYAAYLESKETVDGKR